MENGEQIRFLFFLWRQFENSTIPKINVLKFELKIIEDGEEIRFLFSFWTISKNSIIPKINILKLYWN